MPPRACKRGPLCLGYELDAALQALRNKQLQHKAAQAQRDHLRRQLQLLEGAQQPMAMLQSMVMRSLALPRLPRPQSQVVSHAQAWSGKACLVIWPAASILGAQP